MGNWCSQNDIYQKIKLKYKSQFPKYIINKNASLHLESTYQNTVIQVQQQMDRAKQEKLKSIDLTQAAIEQNFQASKDQLDKKVPGGIKSVESQKKSSIEKLMGFDSYQHKIQTLRGDCNEKYDCLQQQVLGEVEELYQHHLQILKEDEPHLVIYNQLPPDTQKYVFDRGSTEYRDKITTEKKIFEQNIGKKLNPSNFTKKADNILPQQVLQGLVDLSKDKFQSTVEALTHAPVKGFFHF